LLVLPGGITIDDAKRRPGPLGRRHQSTSDQSVDQGVKPVSEGALGVSQLGEVKSNIGEGVKWQIGGHLTVPFQSIFDAHIALAGITWPVPAGMDDTALERQLATRTDRQHRLPELPQDDQ
jgi:hypothetical protein